MTDILTVAGKELREIVGGGSGRKGLIRELFFVFLFGVFFPLSQAEAWRSGAVPSVFVFMIPLFLAGPYIADTFAGERERKTLETLLATRLPDSSIYLGKILAVCTYAWAVTQLILLASLIALNLAGGEAAAAAGSARHRAPNPKDPPKISTNRGSIMAWCAARTVSERSEMKVPMPEMNRAEA